MSKAKPVTVHIRHTCTKQGITFRLGNILIILFISNQKIAVCHLGKVMAYFVSVSQALKEIHTI